MSIQLPKYSIQTTEQKSNRFKAFVYPLTIVICLTVGYFARGLYVNPMIKTLQIRNGVLEEENAINQDKLAQQETEISLLTTENKIKQQATILSQNDYKKLIEAQEEYKSEIKFYERLLSPNSEQKGLRVFETRLQKTTSQLFKLKVVLAQKIERANNIAGSFKITITGKQKNLPKTLQINSNTESKFDFKYFYTVTLNFSLPEGFKPEQLVVELFPQNKKAKTVTYTVDWPKLIKLG